MGEAADKLSQPERIEQRIEQTRSRLDDKLSAIEQRARDAVSVRRRVAGRPWTVVGGAAAVGLAAGLVKGWRGRDDR
ncbi:MAG TPA: hypothetical protein PKK95_12920 [Vicinamibacterales bacterium]|nr:hypothetical protein [Acidobacteriota bacterium]HOC19170.1 hypothetical protein [Vicinamibacterales bacterium]